jgi:membrane protein DedA with SNARE-associated domain
MNIGEQLLNALASYGVPILAAAMFVGCIGVPLPNALLLIAAGSFVAEGQMNLWAVIATCTIAAIAGDLAGYALGRWLGHAVLRRAGPKLKARLDDAETTVRKWDAWAVFLTRWLFTPLGPPVNFISGASQYAFASFLVWDVLGEVIWIILYVSLGRAVGHEVQAVTAMAGDVGWVLLAFTVVILLAWKVFRNRSEPNQG